MMIAVVVRLLNPMLLDVVEVGSDHGGHGGDHFDEDGGGVVIIVIMVTNKLCQR